MSNVSVVKNVKKKVEKITDVSSYLMIDKKNIPVYSVGDKGRKITDQNWHKNKRVYVVDYGSKKRKFFILDCYRKRFLTVTKEEFLKFPINHKNSIIIVEYAHMQASNGISLSQPLLAEQKQIFLEALSREMPSDNQCLQLIDLATNQLVGNTCKNQTTPPFPPNIWAKTSPYLITKATDIYVQNLLPAPGMEPLINSRRLPLQFLAPVYDDLGRLKYAISLQISLIDRRKTSSTPLEGYPVIINEKGVILAHPYIEKVGTNIQQQADAIRLESLVKNAIAGNENFLHLFSLDKDNVELIAGYSSIASPITREKKKKWAILSISPIDSALAPLREIRRILLYMVLTLMGATLLAILIIAHELARPIEKLRDYALSQNYPNSEDNVPPLSNIRELNQLTASVQEMLNHLKAWGKEIESSWQEAQNANKLKTEFLATTSHELRTPLNGIINCIRIVKDDYCDSKEEADDFLQKADDAAIHLLGIINDILEVSRIESGKLSVTCEPIELQRILKEVINIQLIQIKKKQLQLIFYDQQNDLTIYADPAKLKQVLINVLGNAIKFTESGSINISTHVREGRAIISVKDTGIGIEPRDQPKLFRPFVMIDGSTTRRFGGTGLGLAISKNLMQMMMLWVIFPLKKLLKLLIILLRKVFPS
jgi:signal transduction histidine kinase